MALSDYVVAGYFLALPTKRHEGFNDPDLIPPEVFSASGHASVLPNFEWIEWCKTSVADRLERARELGISDDRVPALLKWVTERVDGEVLFPSLCATREVAARLRQVVGPADPRLTEIGLALPGLEVERFLRLTTPPPSRPGTAPMGRPGEAVGLARGEPPASGGVVLGHEPLTSVDGPRSCSWLCNAAEIDVRDTLGIRTNTNGLIDSVDDAIRACAWIDEDTSRGEPGPWFPWLLIRYD